LPGHISSRMSNVQLPRLQSQIKALMNHFTEEDIFRDSLLSLLNIYSQKKRSQKLRFDRKFSVPSFQIPSIVLSELNSNFEQAARDYPNVSFKHSEVLGNMDFPETKLLAFTLLMALPSSYHDEVFERLPKIIHQDNAEELNEKFLDCLEENPAIMRLIQNKKFDYFPKIFRLLTPLFSEPKIEIRHALMEIVTAMISRTEPETASFLISIAKLHANDENRVFIRKCLPLFNTNLQDEIKDAL